MNNLTFYLKNTHFNNIVCISSINIYFLTRIFLHSPLTNKLTPMKKIYLIALCATALLTFSCSSEQTETDPLTEQNVSFFINEMDTTGLIKPKLETDTCTEIDLIAGQYYDAGSVIVTEDEQYLYITYTAENNWKIKATHMYAGVCDDIPQTRSGNPKVGVFDYGTEHSEGTNEVVYAIEKEFFDECFCVAAHAEVVLVDESGNVIQEETAWGEGPQFDGNSWAMYREFCQSGCTLDEEGPVQK